MAEHFNPHSPSANTITQARPIPWASEAATAIVRFPL
ncbi:hypothetical protein ES703_44181 [subsurface metagenome]